MEASVFDLGKVRRDAVVTVRLDAKVKASQSQATGGFSVAKQKADAAATANGDDGSTADGRPSKNVSQWMNDLVVSLSSGGQGAFVGQDALEVHYPSSRTPRTKH